VTTQQGRPPIRRPRQDREKPPPGLRVGDYTLLSRIGEGGMGVVHLARRPGGERVALKVLRPHIVGDDEARARLAREVSSLTRVRSRWVAEILDADPWADVPYVATRYVPGLSLHDHVLAEGPITGADLTWFAGCLAEGLASVHDAGVLHRDVKPSNVLMEGRTPILIDFGLARVADDPKLTHTGWLLGTPGYLAPEILYGDDASAASDVHSWAATVAYAGTGRAPFGRGPSMAIMDRVRRGEHDLTGLPADLRDLVEAALDPDPARRPTLAQLVAWLHPQTSGIQRVLPPEPATTVLPADPFAVPLSRAAQEPARSLRERPTDVLPPPPVRADGGARDFFPWDDEDEDEPAVRGWDQSAPEPRMSLGARDRRLLLVVSGLLLVAGALTALPWPSLLQVGVGTWLLRSGSLAASAAGDRRRLRGRRWYDGVQFLVAAPWHLVRGVPGSLLLALWSAGLAAAAALVCYALAAGLTPTLFACGFVLAGAFLLGPGSSRVRAPLARVVDPVSTGGRRWLVAVLLVLAAATATGYAVESNGTDWTPSDRAPWSGIHTGLPF
jgi:serine/threonine protein kinase